MKKILYILLLCLLLVGCSSSSSGEYTNLSDEVTRNEVATQLVESGLLKENVDKVMNYVKDFNTATVDYTYKDGYTKLPKEGVDYSALFLDEDGNELDSWIIFDIEAINTIDQLNLMKNKTRFHYII